MNKSVRQKSQIIDDDSEFVYFWIEELESLSKDANRFPMKEYQIVSIIGSQSSGKSTLLNALFGTDFEELNRAQRIGQTTKGIWFSVETPSNIIILDVEGSDSNEREERTKVERRNSLFAFAISHTLLINIWIQQIGTFKGAQLEILEVILELNLKLFGVEKPKQIVYVVRDFVEKKENPQALKDKLIAKVEDAWNKIPKPADKAHVRLSDIFELNVFFLPSKIQQKERANWQRGIAQLKDFLVRSTKNPELVRDNIPIADTPRFMENVWKTIEQDKDINLPQEKVLLSSMRCQEIKKRLSEAYADDFRDELEKSERAFNSAFAANIRAILDRLLADYDRETAGYIAEEAERVRGELERELEDRIEESFQKQANLISDDCLREFLEAAGKIFSKDKNMEDMKQLKPKALESFRSSLEKVAYCAEWARARTDKFAVELEKKFESQKEKIVNDSVKEFDRILKKQMENVVSNAFYDRAVFTTAFWPTLREELVKVAYKSKNSIQGLYSKLELGGKKEVREAKIKQLTEKAQEYAEKELRNFVRMKCIDLRYFLMKHFNNEFSNDNDLPRQWPALKEEEIRTLFEDKKKKYLKLIDVFKFVELEKAEPQPVEPAKQRMSMIQTGGNDFKDELIDFKEENELRKKLEDEMKKELEEALRKNKESYSASVPSWAWVVLGVAAFDDILLWLSSPMIALPLTLLLVVVVLVLVFGGKGLAEKLLGTARTATEGLVSNVARSAAGSLIKNE